MKPPAPTLYFHPASGCSRRVLALLGYLDLPFEPALVDLARGEQRQAGYLALNPNAKVPTLVDGDLVLWESNAIARYLDETYGDGDLGGRDPAERAVINRWLFWEAAHWQPAMGRLLAPLVGHRLRPDAIPPPSAPPNWADPGLAPLLRHLEAALDGRAWLALDRLTLADLVVAAMMTYAATAAFSADAYPALDAWYRRLAEVDAWRASAHPLWERR